MLSNRRGERIEATLIGQWDKYTARNPPGSDVFVVPRAIAWREVENHKLLMSPSTPLASSSSSSSLSFTSSSARGLEHCVKYYDSWEEEGLLYIQMELCERGELGACQLMIAHG